MNVLKQYVDDLLGLPEDMLLGSLVFFTVPEGGYDRDELVKAVLDLGLDPALVPHENKPLDAWRKAVKAANEFTYPLPSGQSAHVLIREVEGGKESQLRLVVREIRDSGSRTLRHDVIGEIEFHRPVRHHGMVTQASARPQAIRWTHRGRATPIHQSERVHLERLNDRYMADYKRHLSFMDGAKVRWMLRDALRSMQGVPVRASTFFIRTHFAPQLALWRELMEQRLTCLVWDDNGNVERTHAVMHRVPLLALQESKAMLTAAVNDDTVTQLSDIMRDIAELRNRSKITANAFQAVTQRFKDVMATAAEYTAWLDDRSDDTAASVEMAEAALAGLKRAMLAGEDED